MNSTENDFIQCFGFCGDPISLRLNAMTLMCIVNAGTNVDKFIENNSEQYLHRDLQDKNIDIAEHWTLDCREQIVSLVTNIALGCRRLFDSLEGDNHEYNTEPVGQVIKTTSHDKHSANDELSFINACSRIIHAKKWKIATSCSLSRTPGNALKIETDAGGQYEICLSGFSLSAWIMTKEFQYKNGDEYVTSLLPGIKY